MKYSRIFNLWTDPEAEMPEEYHSLSYILFRTDHNCAEIVAARCPDMKRCAFRNSVIDALNLDEEAQRYLFDCETEQRPMVIKTDVGVGFLDKRYDCHAGLGLYWHVHGRPDSLARLINNGALGDPDNGLFRISRSVRAIEGEVKPSDIPSHRALTEALSVMVKRSGEWAKTDGDGCLYSYDLSTLISQLAEFAGCDLTFEQRENSAQRVKCRRPVLLEVLLLCLLTEARTYGAHSEGVCRVSALGDLEGEGLAFELRYPMEESQKNSEYLDAIHRHLGWVSDLGGLELQSEWIPLRWGERSKGKLPEMRITLEWLRDPAVLSTSDLKAKIRFYYENQPES